MRDVVRGKSGRKRRKTGMRVNGEGEESKGETCGEECWEMETKRRRGCKLHSGMIDWLIDLDDHPLVISISSRELYPKRRFKMAGSQFKKAGLDYYPHIEAAPSCFSGRNSHEIHKEVQ